MRDFLTLKQPSRQSSKNNKLQDKFETIGSIPEQEQRILNTEELSKENEDSLEYNQKSSIVDYAQQLRDEVFNKLGAVKPIAQRNHEETTYKSQ